MPLGARLVSTWLACVPTWTPSSISQQMPDLRGLLDTSVVIDHDVIDPLTLPEESAIAAVTLAELAAGPHATEDPEERARRTDRLQWAAATWDPLPFDAEAARAYGRVFAAARSAGRMSRSRLADLLIASTAVAHGLAMYTRNPADFSGLEQVLDVVAV
jgi:predicted nucleic acid-binding protein